MKRITWIDIWKGSEHFSQIPLEFEKSRELPHDQRNSPKDRRERKSKEIVNTQHDCYP